MQSCNQLSGHISSGGAQPRPSPADGGHFVLALPGRPAGFRAAAEADLLPSLIPSLFVRKVQGCPLVYTHTQTHRDTQTRARVSGEPKPNCEDGSLADARRSPAARSAPAVPERRTCLEALDQSNVCEADCIESRVKVPEISVRLARASK